MARKSIPSQLETEALKSIVKSLETLKNNPNSEGKFIIFYSEELRRYKAYLQEQRKKYHDNKYRKLNQ